MDTHDTTRETKRTENHRRSLILLYCHGISMNAISKLFGSLVMTVLKWIRAFAKKHTPKPTLPPSTTVVLELDEMWHYIGNKKTNFGYGKHLKETPNTS